MVTKAIIREQVLRRIEAGFPSVRSQVKPLELDFAITQVANALLKVAHLNTTYNLDGESIPDGAMVATYENLPVFKGYGFNSMVALPAMPMMLPEKMGVFSVYPSGSPEKEFIPLPQGVYNTLKGTNIFNPIDTDFYTWDNKHITIYADLLGANIPTVDVKLCIADLSAMGDNDILPISADVQADIVNKVVEQFAEGKPERKESIT